MSDNAYFQLSDGEEELCRMTGNAYTLSSNPLVRIVMFFVKILQFFLGSVTRVLVVTTSERVVVIQNQKMLWIFDQSVTSRTVFPRGVSQIGYSMKRSFIFFKTHYLLMASTGETEIFSAKSGEGVTAKGKVEDMIKSVKSLKEKTSGW
jgi:hypothetical protein